MTLAMLPKKFNFTWSPETEAPKASIATIREEVTIDEIVLYKLCVCFINYVSIYS